MAILFTLRVFAVERKSPKKYFLYFITFCISSNPGFTSKGESRLQSQRNRTTSRTNDIEVQHESLVESRRIRTSIKRVAERIEQYDLHREQNRNRMVVNRCNF